MFFLLRSRVTNLSNQVFVGPGLQFSITGFRGAALGFEIGLPVINQSNVPIPVGRFIGGLFLDQNRISQVYISRPVTIQAGGRTMVYVEGAIRGADIIQTVTDILQGGFNPRNANLDLRGNLFYGNVSIPVNYSVI